MVAGRVTIGRFLTRFVKSWAIDIAQGTLAILGLIGAGYIGEIPRESYYAYLADGLILGYFSSALAYRRLRPKSEWALEYAKRFYRFIQWFITIIAAIVAAVVLNFAPLLGLTGAIGKLVIGGVIVLLTLLV